MINTQETSQITKIYLVTNCFGDPNKVYIGKTKVCRKNKHKQKYGEIITYDYIDEVNSLNSKDWKPLECFWIEYFRQLGFELMNKNNGGGGLEYCSEETKLKISKSKSGKSLGPHSCETKNKISNKLKGRKFNENHFDRLKKIVYQFDINGNFIKKWESVSKVSKILNINLSDISSCCRKINKTAGGYIWSYNLETPPPPLRKRKKINQYDIEGNFIKEWSSISEATKFYNIKHNSNLAACCRGISESSHGFKWKYKI